MLYDHNRKIAIEQIPRNGGTSLGIALRAVEDPPGVDDLDYIKIITVRPPVERFLSATRWLVDHPEIWEEGVERLGKGFDQFSLWATRQRELPTIFQPQTTWISEADQETATFLQTRRMASWMNEHQYGHLKHLHVSRKWAIVPRVKDVDPRVVEAIQVRFYKDFAVLNDLAVWPSHGAVKFVMDSGCSTCGS